MEQPNNRQLLVIGTGLIGASVAMAARASEQFNSIVGCTRSNNNADYCKTTGIVDKTIVLDQLAEYTAQLTRNDIVAICTPVMTFDAIVATCLKYQPVATIVDALSVKGYVAQSLQAYASDNNTAIAANVVPCHPIAGSEKSGPQSASATLFFEKQVIITPLAQTGSEYLQIASEFWNCLGASTQTMSVEEHDAIFAATSHLPHILAYALMSTLDSMDTSYNVFAYAASGFKDFSRIAASDPTMWHDISLANSDAILRQIRSYKAQIECFEQAIKNKDSATIMNKISQSQKLRQTID